jgi:hypothetical protein
MSNEIFPAFRPERISLNASDAPGAEVIGFSQLFQAKIERADFDT